MSAIGSGRFSPKTALRVLAGSSPGGLTTGEERERVRGLLTCHSTPRSPDDEDMTLFRNANMPSDKNQLRYMELSGKIERYKAAKTKEAQKRWHDGTRGLFNHTSAGDNVEEDAAELYGLVVAEWELLRTQLNIQPSQPPPSIPSATRPPRPSRTTKSSPNKPKS